MSVAYFLRETHHGIAIAGHSGLDCATDWLKHMFLLDVEDRALVQSALDRALALSRAVPCFTLAYRRDFALLPELLHRIIDHAHGVIH